MSILHPCWALFLTEPLRYSWPCQENTRDSPVYLAYVLPSGIGDPAQYHYLTGYGPDSFPHWTSDISQAEPIPGFERSSGESIPDL